jgi:phosphoglycerate dehydrogenase-like enzyme
MLRRMQVLMLERSYQRVGSKLREVAPELEPLLMAADGSLHLQGQPIDARAARPEMAWANSDLYAGGPVRDFMVLCLKSESLRFVQSSAAGFDHPVFAMLVDKGVQLANSDASAVAIAEFVVSSVLDFFQPNPRRRALQAERRWERTPFREVFGTRWLVIGTGSIGREVAVRARAFGAHVIGVRRHPRGDEPVDRMLTPSELPAVLPEIDVVALCAPANADTRHMVDAAFLARMRERSVLVNIGRGSLVDEAALLSSLDRGVPEVAILDVFETEPLPQDSGLWSHPRVRVSAHDAAFGDGFLARNDALFLSNAARFAAGQTPLRLVDPATVKG